MSPFPSSSILSHAAVCSFTPLPLIIIVVTLLKRCVMWGERRWELSFRATLQYWFHLIVQKTMRASKTNVTWFFCLLPLKSKWCDLFLCLTLHYQAAASPTKMIRDPRHTRTTSKKGVKGVIKIHNLIPHLPPSKQEGSPAGSVRIGMWCHDTILFCNRLNFHIMHIVIY